MTTEENKALRLYEIGNGFIGNSFVRVYCVASSENIAIEMAIARFKQCGYDADAGVKISNTMSVFDGVCSFPSDEGLEILPIGFRR